MATNVREKFGFTDVNLLSGKTSISGSAEDDSMSSSENSLYDFQGQGGRILLQYDGSANSFPENNALMMAKPMAMRRVSEKRMCDVRSFNHSSTAFDGFQNYGAFCPEGMEGNTLLLRAMQGSVTSGSGQSRRQRGEKKPIPSEQKDSKYFERRKRNNHAAKKSRDYRKAREDEIAMKAGILEKQNAFLKATLSTLKNEADELRSMIAQKRQQQTAQYMHMASLAHMQL